jgi:predicted RNA-binding Zn-ribbon protein involved in translation (DUF1610 family)
LGDHLADVPCVALGRPNCGRALRLRCGRALGRPTCRRALRCGRALPCVADVPCVVDVPCLAFRTCLVLRWGAQLAYVRTCLALRTRVGAPNLRTCLALRTRVGAPNLRTCLALRWGAQLADVPCVAFGCPSCGRALRCVGAANLGEAVLKGLPPSQNLFLSILQLVF